MSSYDPIIVGAGSAGCVLAYRLSQDPKNSVLLIEAGPADTNPYIRIPMGTAKTLSDPGMMWYYRTEPEEGTAGQARNWMRGKVLGGSSAINGMIYCRGNPDDYDGWERMGNTGWGWKQIGAAFAAIENHGLGADGVRGIGGPLDVSVQSHRSPVVKAILQANAAEGTPVRADVNRPDQHGIGYATATIKNGRRVSSASAFLAPARQRSNLRIVTDTTIHKILFQGKRAVAVVGSHHGSRREYRAAKEIIVSAGGLESPKLLQLSGIGPAGYLKDLGIDVVADSPGVGQNMREHKWIGQQVRLTRCHSHNVALKGLRLGANALRYQLLRSGPLATTIDAVGFIKTRPGLERPDAEVMFWSLSFTRDGNVPKLQNFPGMMALAWPLLPESQGSVVIRSSDPADAPLIRPNFLSAGHDREVLTGAFRYLRRIFQHPMVAPFVAEETHPGPATQSDAEILDFMRLEESNMHATGTCKMGQDGMAAVDAKLHVHGVTGLRVMDLSIFPTRVSGNTNGPAMALAWRAADLILEG